MVATVATDLVNITDAESTTKALSNDKHCIPSGK